MFTGPDRVFTGPDGVMAQPDGVEIKGVHNISAEEQSKILADVAAYKARISFLESKLAELGFTEDASNDDSVVWAEELFENRVVEHSKNQAEDQAPMPTVPVFPPNEADRKGKRQMIDLELWRFENRVDPQTMVQEQLDSLWIGWTWLTILPLPWPSKTKRWQTRWMSCENDSDMLRE
jgi:hypothetical protein